MSPGVYELLSLVGATSLSSVIDFGSPDISLRTSCPERGRNNLKRVFKQAHEELAFKLRHRTRALARSGVASEQHMLVDSRLPIAGERNATILLAQDERLAEESASPALPRARARTD